MSQHEKLAAKLLNLDVQFTWQELATLLGSLGYRQRPGRGSRVKFETDDSAAVIALHKPHPGNELKPYARRQVIAHLKTEGLIE